MEILRQKLSPDKLDAAWAEGAGMSAEEVSKLVFEENNVPSLV
jgi:hypothetical protein